MQTILLDGNSLTRDHVIAVARSGATVALDEAHGEAAACGIDVARINALTFAFGSGLAGVAGVMMSGFKTVFPDMGTPMVVDGFMVVVMGGVGSLLGSVFSAGILGEINGLVAAGTNDILARAVVFGVVIMIIILKPKGLFSLRGR